MWREPPGRVTVSVVPSSTRRASDENFCVSGRAVNGDRGLVETKWLSASKSMRSASFIANMCRRTQPFSEVWCSSQPAVWGLHVRMVRPRRSRKPQPSWTASAPSTNRSGSNGPAPNPTSHIQPGSSRGSPGARTCSSECVVGRRLSAPSMTRPSSAVTSNPSFSSTAANSRLCSKQ